MNTPILPEQKHAPFSPQGAIERTRWWLARNEDVAILYASLELRYTFELILIKHGWASEDDSDDFNVLNWQPKRLHKTLRQEFAEKIDITKSYKFYLEQNDESAQLLVATGLRHAEVDGSLTLGYFLAVPPELFDRCHMLNDNLHATWAGRDCRLPQRPWYTEQHRFLSELLDSLIPHASSRNDLNVLHTPGTKWEEVDGIELEKLLRREGQY